MAIWPVVIHIISRAVAESMYSRWSARSWRKVARRRFYAFWIVSSSASSGTGVVAHLLTTNPCSVLSCRVACNRSRGVCSIVPVAVARWHPKWARKIWVRLCTACLWASEGRRLLPRQDRLRSRVCILFSRRDWTTSTGHRSLDGNHAPSSWWAKCLHLEQERCIVRARWRSSRHPLQVLLAFLR